MAFSAEELRVLRSALATVLQPAPVPDHAIRQCLRLAEAVDEVIDEQRRQRAFLVADLARYRDALPGSASGYLAHLREALAVGYQPEEADLLALRELCIERTGLPETARRTALLVRAALPAARTPLRALPAGGGTDEEPASKPGPDRSPRPAEPEPDTAPRPSRPVPTPGEVFPPRRRPKAPSERERPTTGPLDAGRLYRVLPHTAATPPARRVAVAGTGRSVYPLSATG